MIKKTQQPLEQGLFESPDEGLVNAKTREHWRQTAIWSRGTALGLFVVAALFFALLAETIRRSSGHNGEVLLLALLFFVGAAYAGLYVFQFSNRIRRAAELEEAAGFESAVLALKRYFMALALLAFGLLLYTGLMFLGNF